MFSILKKNIGKSVFLGVLTITGLLMLANALIKAIFILSNESAVQKAEVIDVVLGTLSLGLVLVALLAITGVTYLVFIKKMEFDKKLVIGLFGAAALLFISALLVVVKDHTSYAGDWAKLNDLAQARADIAKNLVVANSLVGDSYGNVGAINPTGTSVMTDLAPVISSPELLNSLNIKDYSDFLTQVISSKKDLAALYAVDELLNKVHEPLIAGKIVDGLAAAWQVDHAITASSWFANVSNSHPYDFLSIVNGYVTTGTDGKYEMTNGLAGNAEAHKLLSAMSTPLVFTELTEAYLQTFPITLTVIGLTTAASVGYFGSTLFGKVAK